MRRAFLVVLTACTSGVSGSGSRPAPLDPLPPPAPADTMRFRDASACAQCHLVDETTSVLHDATGANVSPVLLWRSSLMAMAARDPYYLAVVSEQPDALCVRCHAPAGTEEIKDSGGTLDFQGLVSATTPAAILGRSGVTCTLCHQIGASNLGQDTSFSGGFQIGYGRMLFGRYGDPATQPMQLIVNYTPTAGTHIESSALCGTCHTVIVKGLVEQATFLEWRSSSFPGDGKDCQTCHVPAADSRGAPISTVVASFPSTLQPRSPVGKHTFVGGNSYVLSLLADAVDWANPGISADELLASADRDNQHLAGAAKISIASATRDTDGTLVVTVHVANQTGHKLPTGYPTRKLWLHVTAGGWESGAGPSEGPHRDVITDPSQVQVWEAVMVDSSGKPTHRALDAVRYSKDDRILPTGFAPSTADAARTQVVGVTADATFVPGSDDVTYRMTGVAAGTPVVVDLCYESLSASVVAAIDAAATPAGTKFVDLAQARPVTPIVIASTIATAP